ncbi:MAG: hypothetical protein ACI9P7_001648, partial [Candidatus Azotimanducaceae bacterium]
NESAPFSLKYSKRRHRKLLADRSTAIVGFCPF